MTRRRHDADDRCGICGTPRDPEVPWQWKDEQDRPICLKCVRKRIERRGQQPEPKNPKADDPS